MMVMMVTTMSWVGVVSAGDTRTWIFTELERPNEAKAFSGRHGIYEYRAMHYI